MYKELWLQVQSTPHSLHPLHALPAYDKALSMLFCVPMMLVILQFKVVIITLSLCEFACEATTVRQAFNSNTPADKGEIACHLS